MLFSTWLGRTLHTTSRCSARVSRLHRTDVNNARRIRLTSPPSIFRALGFVGGVSAVTYMGCAAWSVHTNERIARETDASTSFSFFLGMRKNYEMLVQNDRAERWAQGYHRLAVSLQAWPHALRRACLCVYEKVADTYLGLPTYQQAVVPLVALHTAVFAAWMLSPALRTTSLMYRLFTHRPASGRVVTLLTSATSHKGLAHFVLNNLALWSVGSSAIQALPRDKRDARVEADTQPHFVAFYVAAGLFASLVSHLALALRWRMVPKPAQLLARRASLGASGAIYAAFALCACTMPHVQLSLVFLPMLTFPIKWGFGSLVLLDVVGAVRGWRVFDHVAHLGGAAFGFVYYFVGPSIWNTCRGIYGIRRTNESPRAHEVGIPAAFRPW